MSSILKSKGEGSLYYSETRQRYVIQYIEPLTHKKKQIVQKKNEDIKEFKKKYIKLLNDINEQKYNKSSRITLSDIIENQIVTLYNANKISQNSYLRKTYTFRIIKSLDLSTIPLQALTTNKINQDLSTITNYSNSTIAKVCGMISSAYDYAIAQNLVSINPFKMSNVIVRPKSEKDTKKIEAFTIEEQVAFEQELKKSKDTYKDVFYILLYTGMRVGEALALKGTDINIKNQTISITRTITKDKNDKVILGKTTKTYAGTRTIPIIPKLIPILSKYSQINNFIFLNNNNLIASSTINTHFKKICKDAGINVYINYNKTKIIKGEKIKTKLKTSHVNTHMLRHTFATRCIEAGMSAISLSKILGHKNIQTTLNTYTSVFDRYQKSELDKVINYLDKINQSSVN